MIPIVYFIISLIILTLYFKVCIEGFISYSDYIKHSKKSIKSLVSSNKKYKKREFIINDVLKSLNCKNVYSFQLVNISLQDNYMNVTLFDRQSAAVLVLNIYTVLAQEKDKVYYAIQNIQIAEQERDDPGRFYDPYFENHPNPFE